ncbi:hypothetical protein FQA47_002959 [Oryzias melastigma]|uniref:Fibronectin type-III domain-containing protein n=1 Tax=Oryzias melastigma TaxID=30732 RepID=A0A834C5A1_ORYME|nr:hypothetical protein FQA47_002959 [Oryzias melastigma]
MSSTPFLVGILFLALFVTDVYSVLNSLKGSSIVLSPDVEEPSIISVTWKHGADLAAEWFGGSVTFYRSFKGGDVDQSDESKETNPFLSEIEKCNAESSVTVTAEINSQNDPNTTNTQEPDQNPDPVLSIESKPDPETNTTNRPEPDESPDPAPSSETRPDPEETRPNQESRVTVTAEINHQNGSGSAENDPPETERAEASSGSPDGGVSTSESSCEQ